MMDSGVSRIQMWQERKTKERQEKRRAHYEETARKLLKRLWKPQRKLEKPRVDNYGMGLCMFWYGMFQLWYVPIKDATKKCWSQQNQQKLHVASENKGKLGKEKDGWRAK